MTFGYEPADPYGIKGRKALERLRERENSAVIHITEEQIIAVYGHRCDSPDCLACKEYAKAFPERTTLPMSDTRTLGEQSIPRMTQAHIELVDFAQTLVKHERDKKGIAEVLALVCLCAEERATVVPTDDLEWQIGYTEDARDKATPGWDRTRLHQIAEAMRGWLSGITDTPQEEPK